MSTTPQDSSQDPTYQARIDIENGISTLADNGWTPDEIETFVDSAIEELETELEDPNAQSPS